MGHRFILAMAIAYHRLGSQMGVCQQYQGSPHSIRSALLNTQLETVVNKLRSTIYAFENDIMAPSAKND
jgi:hypothetical protein